MPSGLGRGLGSLIPPKNEQPTAVNSSSSANGSSGGILQIDINNIVANSQQPRTIFEKQALDELSASIKEHGVLQPIVVSKTGDSYQIIAGERRFRASKMAGLTKIPATVRQVTEEEKLVLALVENIQRQDLNIIDEARAYVQLLEEHQVTQERLGKMLGKPRSSITNVIRLLNLPQPVQDALFTGKIGKEQAKVIAGIDGEKNQLALLQNIIDNKLSKRNAIIASRKMGGTRDSRIKYIPTDVRDQRIIEKALGYETKIVRGDRGIGTVVITFYGQEELEAFIKKIQ